MLDPESALPDLPDEATLLGEFIRGLAKAVRAQAAEQQQQMADHWARPLAERVAAGRALADVRVREVLPGGMLKLGCAHNESRFREGDVLCLSREGPTSTPRFLLTLEYDDENELLLSSEEPSVTVFAFAAQPEGWILDEGYLDFSDTILAALDEAADTAAGRERILPLLTGQARPKSDPERYLRAIAQAEQWGLNHQQGEAFAQAYACEQIHLIQGPPGTGKTMVLARLAQLLAQDGERVLITAFTHRAINNALNKLAELDARHDATPTTTIKIGHAARSDDLRVPNFERFDASLLLEDGGGYIVGATPFATRTSRLRGVTFDTVIFDEASQITLPLAIMGMLVAKRFIFVGDHKQLPPVLATRYGNEILRDSVFSVLCDQGFDTMLEETYRLNRVLTGWPSDTFYNGQLRPVAAAADRQINYANPPTRFHAILAPAQSKVFVDLNHQHATTRSEPEAQLAADLVVELLACGLAPSEIGVVTPYRAQARAIRRFLREALPDEPEERRALVVDTVERMQGQEREAVIVSFATSDPLFASRIADFLFQPERLNVAITRPRSKLIILASSHLLRASPPDAEQREAVELLEGLLMSCTQTQRSEHDGDDPTQ